MWGWWKKSFRNKRKKAASKPEVFDLVIGTYFNKWQIWLAILALCIGTFVITQIFKRFWSELVPGFASSLGVVLYQSLSKRSSYRFAKRNLHIQQDRAEASFTYRDLNVDGPTKYNWKADEYLVFWDEQNTFYLNVSSFLPMLSAEAVWALAELQHRGAKIWVAGFGSYEYPDPPKHIEKYKAARKPLMFITLFSLLMAAVLIAAGFAGLIPAVNLLPLLLLVPLFWIGTHVKRILANNGEPEVDSNSVEVTEDEVLLFKRWKIYQRVKLEDIKTIFVSIEPKTLNRIRISVEIQTHYARSFKLINGGSDLSFSHCLFLENARDLGLHIVYRRVVTGSGEMVVIHEVEPEVQIMQFGETYERDLLSQFVQPNTEINEEV